MSRFGLSIAALSLAGTSLLAPATFAHAAVAQPSATSHHHACTRTSTGKCIRGGEFCPQRDYQRSGYDAKGRRYVCKGNRKHPHWAKP